MRLQKEYKDADRRPVVPPKGISDYLALAWATGLFTGYAPVAPGTFGSALAAVGFYALTKSGLLRPFDLAMVLPYTVLCVLVSYSGIWAATRAVGFFGHKDPGHVTVDEVAGQLITYLFLPLLPNLASVPWILEGWTIVGFFLFRALDIVKPYPCRQLEALKGGLGIMADDILAGIQGAIIMLAAGTIFSKLS